MLAVFVVCSRLLKQSQVIQTWESCRCKRFRHLPVCIIAIVLVVLKSMIGVSVALLINEFLKDKLNNCR